MSSCSQREWQPNKFYSEGFFETTKSPINCLETPLDPLGSRPSLKRSQSCSKLKVIEELSLQIKCLQTQLEKAYEEIERLKRVGKVTNGLEHVKSATMDNYFVPSVGHHCISEYYLTKSDAGKLERKRSFPTMSYRVSEKDLGELDSNEHHKHSFCRSSSGNNWDGWLTEDSTRHVANTAPRQAMWEINCSPNETVTESTLTNNSFKSFIPETAAMSELSDRLAMGEWTFLKDSFIDLSSPLCANEKESWNRDRSAYSDSTSLEGTVDNYLGMRRDSFTFSDLSAAECFSEDVDSLSLGSILDDVTINADESIWSYGHSHSDWQLQ